MAAQVTATEAKAGILRLLDEVENGQEIEITRHGKTVARLVPATGARLLAGSLRDVASTSGAEEELFSTGEQWEAADR